MTAETQAETQETKELKANTPQVVSGVFDRIKECWGERKDAESKPKKWEPPCIQSKESVSNYKKMIETAKEAYLEASLVETWHMHLLLASLEEIQAQHPEIHVGQIVTEMAERHPLDPKRQALLNAQAQEDQIEERKSEKKAKELDGQLSLFDTAKLDDGSEAEAASDCTTTKVAPDQIDHVLEGRELPALLQFAENDQPQGEAPVDVEVKDVTDTWDAPQRDLIHGLLTPKEYDELMDLYRAGDVLPGREKLNGYIEERVRKGKNKLFKTIDAELMSVYSAPDAEPESQPEPPVEEEMSELQKKAAERKAKRAAKAAAEGASA